MRFVYGHVSQRLYLISWELRVLDFGVDKRTMCWAWSFLEEGRDAFLETLSSSCFLRDNGGGYTTKTARAREYVCRFSVFCLRGALWKLSAVDAGHEDSCQENYCRATAAVFSN